MYKKLIAMAICSLVSVTTVAQDSTWYAGLGAGFMTADTEDAFETDLNFKTFQVLGGYQFNEYFAAELRYGTTTGPDEFGFFGFDAEADVNYFASAYVKAIYPASEGFNVYALLGKTRAEVEVCIAGFSCDSVAENDTSYGAGIAFVRNEFSFNIEAVEAFEDTTTINLFVNMAF